MTSLDYTLHSLLACVQPSMAASQPIPSKPPYQGPERRRRSRERQTAATITDADADAYLPRYDKSEDYPALTSRNLERRENAESKRIAMGSLPLAAARTLDRDTGLSGGVQGVLTHAASPLAATLENWQEERIEELIAALQLKPDVETMFRYRTFNRFSYEQIAMLCGTNKQAVHRKMSSAAVALAQYLLCDPEWGMGEVLRAAFNRTVLERVSHDFGAVSARVCDCGSHQFSSTQQKDATNQRRTYYRCDHCKTARTAAEYRSLETTVRAGRSYY